MSTPPVYLLLSEEREVTGDRTPTSEVFGDPKLVRRVLDKCAPDERGCWIWTGSSYGTDGAYGQSYLDGRRLGAHRLSYLVFVGPVPAGLDVMHLCDVPKCVNPAHLEPGTRTANLLHAVDVHGAWTPRGEASPKSKLTEAQVRIIRRRHAQGETLAALGREYGVTYVAIRKIVLRQSWAHVDAEPEAVSA